MLFFSPYDYPFIRTSNASGPEGSNQIDYTYYILRSQFQTYRDGKDVSYCKSKRFNIFNSTLKN